MRIGTKLCGKERGDTLSWQDEYRKKKVSVKEAAAAVRPGDRICSATGCSVPRELLEEIGKRKDELHGVQIYSQLLLEPLKWLEGEYKEHIHYNSSFMGGAERKYLKEGNVSLTPYQFSRTDWLLENQIRPTVFVGEVSLPDENGDMSFGAMGNVWGRRASQLAERVILQVNRNVPYLCGGECAKINVREAYLICESEADVPQLLQAPVTEDDEKIAAFIMPYIEDGSTIQLGLGGVANAVGFSLRGHRHLGIHSEMLTDSMVELMEAGAVDNSRKTLNPGKTVISFALGSKKLYEYVNHNSDIDARPISYVANPFVIGGHQRFISINSCLACDLTGQVGSEALGFAQFSGTGGQLDFVRGAALSEGGRSFLCLRSRARAKDGTMVSRITASLLPGTAVTTPRTDVDCIVTEYGVAELAGKDLEARANAMISIAHPDFREELEREARENGLIWGPR